MLCTPGLTFPTSQTSVYAQGAGLGASKPKDIGKYTEAQSGSYADKAQDAVSNSSAAWQQEWNALITLA